MMESKIQRVEISFGAAVSLPDGWERALDALVGMVCDQYKREHPDRVMWPSEQGFAPTHEFYAGDFENAKGPMFDESVYVIGCHEREDYHGTNPHNPDRDKLREAVSAERKAAKVARKQWPVAVGVGRDAENPRALSIVFDREPTDDELRALHEGLK